MSFLKTSGIALIVTLLVVVIAHQSPQGGVGATITSMLGTDKLSDSRAVINTNFANLNSDKIEVSTTTLPLVTTLTNLVTIGTIGTGVWEGTTVDELFGGTGFSTYAQGDIIFASATNVLSTLTASSTNEVLTLVGGVPIWRDSTVNEAAIFNWSGPHSWSDTTTFNATTTHSANIIGGVDQFKMTASTTIIGWTLPQPVYMATSTGAIELSDANVTVAKNFLGFAVTNALNGETVLVQTDGVVRGFTGLTQGSEYFVQDTAGTIGTSVGTSEVSVGSAISTTEILIATNESSKGNGTDTYTVDTSNDTVALFQYTGWRPKAVMLSYSCDPDGADLAIGVVNFSDGVNIRFGDTNGTLSVASSGCNDTTSANTGASTLSISSITSGGFTITITRSSANGTASMPWSITWVAIK